VVDPLKKSMLTPQEAQYRKSGIFQNGQILADFDDSMSFAAENWGILKKKAKKRVTLCLFSVTSGLSSPKEPFGPDGRRAAWKLLSVRKKSRESDGL
jgi:hypothetical protein